MHAQFGCPDRGSRQKDKPSGAHVGQSTLAAQRIRQRLAQFSIKRIQRTRALGQGRDGDTLSNAQEYIAGTDPKDAQSYLRIDAASGDSGGTVLTFVAVSNRTYSIVYRTNVTSGSWLRLIDIAPPVLTNRSISISNNVGSEAERIYRLVVPKLP